jgi:heme-degrading monooxygenase HmoA
MYITLRRYAGAAARMDEIASKVKQGLVPILARAAGFKGYCVVKADSGDGVSVTLFEGEDQAAQANEQAKSWVQSDLRDLLPDPPEIFAGNVVVNAEAKGPGGPFGGRSGELYVVIREFENMTVPDEAVRFARETSVPLAQSSPGFLAFYSAWGDPGRTKAAVVTLFDSRENAEQANRKALAMIREKGGSVIPSPARVVTGEASVLVPAT